MERWPQIPMRYVYEMLNAYITIMSSLKDYSALSPVPKSVCMLDNKIANKVNDFLRVLFQWVIFRTVTLQAELSSKNTLAQLNLSKSYVSKLF